jgi:hypothetical protein
VSPATHLGAILSRERLAVLHTMIPARTETIARPRAFIGDRSVAPIK